MMLSNVASFVGGELIGDDCEFSSISTDTRSLTKGELFVALKGEHFDANKFLETAEKKGAIAVVTQDKNASVSIPQVVVDDSLAAFGKMGLLKRKNLNGKIIAITGSSGKTTVKGMLALICSNVGSTSYTKGNFNNQIGVPLTLWAAKDDSKFVVVEAGTNSSGEIGYLTKIISPDVALVNNVGSAHIGYFGGRDRIAEEKFAIYGGATSQSIAIVNLDDDFSREYLDKLSKRNIFAFTLDDISKITEKFNLRVDKIVYAKNIFCDQLGRYRFDLCFNRSDIRVNLNVVGHHNIANALAASCCAVASNIGLEKIAAGLASYSGEVGRMQIIKLSDDLILVDDTYNANPESMEKAINWVSQFDDSLLVVGDMAELGSQEKILHKRIGKHAKNMGVKKLMACGKFSEDIVEEFGQGGNAFNKKEDLEEYLSKEIGLFKVVLFKGSRSAKMETIINHLVDNEA